MAERFSTQFLKQQGARRLTVQVADRFVNTFQDSTGAENFFDAANVVLSENGLVSASLNADHFFIAKSFFMKRGVSETVAITMAVLAIDAAKMMGVSVMKALQPLTDSTDLMLSFETFVAMNQFRPVSNQQTYLVPKTNTKSLRNRDIAV